MVRRMAGRGEAMTGPTLPHHPPDPEHHAHLIGCGFDIGLVSGLCRSEQEIERVFQRRPMGDSSKGIGSKHVSYVVQRAQRSSVDQFQGIGKRGGPRHGGRIA